MKLNKKVLALLVSAALLLTFTVSGTVAYLVDASGPVENQFKPATFETTPDEDFFQNVKSRIQIKNTGSVKAYIRVALVGNWVMLDENDKEVIVEPYMPNFTLGDNWVQYGDYYYYTLPVDTNGETSDLLGSDISETVRADGSYLVLTVIQQSIQAEPVTAVQEAWKVTITQDNVTPYTSTTN